MNLSSFSRIFSQVRMSPLARSVLCLAILFVTTTAQQPSEGCLAQLSSDKNQAYANCCPQADKQPVTVSGKTYTLHCGKEVTVVSPSSPAGDSPKECANDCSKDAADAFCIGSYWGEEGVCYSYKLHNPPPDPNAPPLGRLAMVPLDDTSKSALAKCNGDLNTCTGNLNTCRNDLTTTTGELTKCKGDLSQCQTNQGNTDPSCPGELSKCKGDLNQCQANQGNTDPSCPGELSKCKGDLNQCQTNQGKADPSCPGKLDKCTKDLANAQKGRKGGLKNPLEKLVRKKCGKPNKKWTKRAHTYASWRKCTVLGLLPTTSNQWIKNDPEECARLCSEQFECTVGILEPYDKGWVCRYYPVPLGKAEKDKHRNVILRLD